MEHVSQVNNNAIIKLQQESDAQIIKEDVGDVDAGQATQDDT